MKNPKVCVLRTAGTNCDKETAAAFSRVGGAPELVHINRFVEGTRRLSEFNILNFEEEPLFIDLSQTTTTGHPQAREFLERDVHNIVKFFKRLGVETDEKEVLVQSLARELREKIGHGLSPAGDADALLILGATGGS